MSILNKISNKKFIEERMSILEEMSIQEETSIQRPSSGSATPVECPIKLAFSGL